MTLKIGSELSSGHDKSQSQFFWLAIPNFIIKQSFTDIIDWRLFSFIFAYKDGAYSVFGDCKVDV